MWLILIRQNAFCRVWFRWHTRTPSQTHLNYPHPLILQTGLQIFWEQSSYKIATPLPIPARKTVRTAFLISFWHFWSWSRLERLKCKALNWTFQKVKKCSVQLSSPNGQGVSSLKISLSSEAWICKEISVCLLLSKLSTLSSMLEANKALYVSVKSWTSYCLQVLSISLVFSILVFLLQALSN